MLTFLEEFPDHMTSLFRSSNNILISGDFNIPWNKPENLDSISMQEILDMCDLNQHIHRQTHRLGNTIDRLISNTVNIIQDIRNKDYISDDRLIEWKFQINKKPTEKISKSRGDLTKISEESFNIDLKKNLQTDLKKPPTKL